MATMVYLPYTPPDHKDIRVLKSGAVYRATRQGWVRLNHPSNKHERRKGVNRNRISL